MSKKKSEHYVNNKELLEALIVYRSKVEKSFMEINGREPTKADRSQHWPGKPQITNYLGECFLKIATHLSYKPNFVNYMFRDDMISDGIENCVQYIHTLIQKNLRIRSLTSHKLSTTPFYVEFRKRRSNWKSKPRSLNALVTMKL